MKDWKKLTWAMGSKGKNWLLQKFAFVKWLYLAKRENIYLELGSGPKKGRGAWTTVDERGADICYDLRKGLPLPDNTVDKIYSSHMLEHIPFPQLKEFIVECHRVLKPGGELSICVPDASLYIKAYIEKKNFRDMEDAFGPAVVNTGSAMDQLNYVAYMNGQHCYLFDQENLQNTLRLAPFKVVTLRQFDESLDMDERDFESIYALAVK